MLYIKEIIENYGNDETGDYVRLVDRSGAEFNVRVRDFKLMSANTRFQFQRISTFTKLSFSNLYSCGSFFIYSKKKLNFLNSKVKSNPMFTISLHSNVPNYHPVLAYLLTNGLIEIESKDLRMGNELYNLFDFFIYPDF